MAKDVTIRVTGQNADGTLNVQIPDGGNPFLFGGGQQQTQMEMCIRDRRGTGAQRRLESADAARGQMERRRILGQTE